MADEKEKAYVNLTSDSCDKIGRALKDYGVTVEAEWVEDRLTGEGFCDIAFNDMKNLGVTFDNTKLKYLNTVRSHLGAMLLYDSVIDSVYLKDIRVKELETHY